MAITINGDGTLTGISVGGLPDGIVDTDMLATDAVSAAKLKSDAIAAGDLPAGSILQIQHALKTDPQIIQNTTAKVDITDLTATITPAANSSKIIVLLNMFVGTTSQAYWGIHIFRGTTELFQGDAYSSNNRDFFGTQGGTNYENHSVSGCYVDDSHNSGGTAITYKVSVDTPWSSTYKAHINHSGATTDGNSYMSRGSSSLILMEVAG